MKGSQRIAGDTSGGYTRRSVACSVPLEWREEWFTTICLIITLVATIFLMLLSIYLVVTKPAPSSLPGGNGERPLKHVHADRFAAVHGAVQSGPVLEPGAWARAHDG